MRWAKGLADRDGRPGKHRAGEICARRNAGCCLAQHLRDKSGTGDDYHTTTPTLSRRTVIYLSEMLVNHRPLNNVVKVEPCY
jgi:hypothetical protein